MLSKAIWPASATVPGAQGPLSPCFKCGENGYWVVACPNSPGSPLDMSKVLSRGILVTWLSPCTPWQGDIKHRLPSSWPWTTEGTGLSWPHHCHLWQLAPGGHHDIRVIHLLSLRHWCLRKFGGPTSCFSPIVSVEGQHYLPRQTSPLNFIYRGTPLSHSVLVVPICPVFLLGRDLLAKARASIPFAFPIRLTPDSPAAPLLLLDTHPTGSNMSFHLSSSQLDTQVWDIQNPSVARHYSPIVIQLEDPA